jgi:hypothetical protein
MEIYGRKHLRNAIEAIRTTMASIIEKNKKIFKSGLTHKLLSIGG